MSRQTRCEYLRLSGALDFSAVPSMRQEMETLDADHIQLDVSEVDLISAAFVTELVRLRKRLPRSRIQLIGARPFVRKVLSLVEADRLLEVPRASC